MTRNIFLFLGTFVAGAVIALVIRAATFAPHAGHQGHAPAADYAPMVSNALTPTKSESSSQPVTPTPTAATPDHSAHAAAAAANSKFETPNSKPPTPNPNSLSVNSVCAICGMDVDPKLPTLDYQGKKIGFGCKMCPPKFKAQPDKYGPYYLRNEVMPK